MSARFVTQVLEETKPSFWVIGERTLFSHTLCAVLSTAKFSPEFFAWGTEQTQAFQAGVAPERIILLGRPPNQPSLEVLKSFLSRFEGQITQVLFDPLEGKSLPPAWDHHQRQNDAYQVMLQEGGLRLQVLWYAHVCVPDSPSFSLLDQMFRDIKEHVVLSCVDTQFSPLWYEDCITHLLSRVLQFEAGKRVYEGSETIRSFAFLKQVFPNAAFLHSLPTTIRVPSPFIAGEKVQGRGVADISQSMAQFYRQSGKETLEEHKPQVLSSPKRHILPSLHRVARVIFVVGCIVGSFYGSCLVLGKWYQDQIRQEIGILAAQSWKNEEEASSHIQRVSSFLSQLQVVRQVTRFPGHLFTQETDKTENTLKLIHSTVDTVQKSAHVTSTLQVWYQYIMDQKGKVTKPSFSESDLDGIYQSFSSIQAQVMNSDELDPHLISPEDVGTFKTMLTTQRKNITTLRSLVSILPSFVGTQERRTVAVVLQDTDELRSSGGPIIGVGTIVFEKGKVLDTQAYSIDALNQFLSGNVVPPQEVSFFLHQNNWQIQDAAWDVDFTKGANQITWFLDKQLHTPVDSVIALNMNALPELLTAIGPVEVSGKAQPLTSTNILEYIRSIAREGASAQSGTEAYKNILSTLFLRLQALDEKESRALFSMLRSELEQTNILIADSHEAENTVFSSLGWNGSLITPECPTVFAQPGECHVQTGYLVEQNVGHNKVNRYVTTTQTHTILVSADQTLHERLIHVKNTSPSSVWPYGSYQAVMKLLTSSSSRIQEIDLNGQPLLPQEIALSVEGNHAIARMYLDLPAGQEATLRVVYTDQGVREGDSLAFLEQKQPGITPESYTLIVKYPEHYAPTAIAPKAEVGLHTLTFHSQTDENHMFAVKF
jgi:hypothetical protein